MIGAWVTCTPYLAKATSNHEQAKEVSYIAHETPESMAAAIDTA